ncbi:Copia protein, partial [Termitomyces sp. T112]
SALHTPNLSANLISIGKFDDLVFSMVFKGRWASFVDPSGRTFMTREKKNRMYLLDLTPASSLNPALKLTSTETPSDTGATVTKVLVATSLDKLVPLDIWHQRFGHASVQSIRKLNTKQMVSGLHIQGNSNAPGLCKDCIYGKHTTRPYNGNSEDVQTAGKKVYIDLWAAYLANKAGKTTLAALKSYVTEAERQTRNKLKTIQINDRREWVNQLWHGYCQEMGIVMKPVVPYAHSQNGVIEHSIRTVFNGVQCLLAESGLPKSLWGEAAATIIYTRNLLPSSRHPDAVPEERWMGKKQDVGHLHPFGCVGYARVPEELTRSKLDPRSVKYILVGYSSHGYHLYDKAHRLIITSRDVIFEEGSGHRTVQMLDDDSLENSTVTLQNPATSLILPVRQQITPRIRATDGPLHPVEAPSDAEKPLSPDDLPIALRRSARTIRPMRAILEAWETLTAQSAAHAAGEEWAGGDCVPEALLTTAFAFLASTEAGGDLSAPRSYWEAMRRPDLWVPAMEAKLDVMKEKKVWDVVRIEDIPAGKKMVDCMWVYVNKYNAEGEIVKRKACLVAKGASTTEAGSQVAKAELGSKFEVKNMGELKYILGRSYLEPMLDRFGFRSLNPRHTPLSTRLILTESQSPQNDDDKQYMKDKPYHEALGSLILLVRFQSNPGPAHWKALAHVMQYVNGTLDYRIMYRSGTDLKPIGYVDADYEGDLDTCCSTGGYVFTMARGAVWWSSKRQPTVALSTTKAEYMALTRGVQQAMWMYNWLLDVDLPQMLPAILRVDNSPALFLAQYTKGHACAKHIDIQHYYIRERVKMEDIDVIYIPSTKNPADLFTKPLASTLHTHMIKLLGLSPTL